MPEREHELVVREIQQDWRKDSFDGDFTKSVDIPTNAIDVSVDVHNVAPILATVSYLMPVAEEMPGEVSEDA